MTPARFAAALLLVLVPLARSQQVFVIDASGAGDYTTSDDAIWNAPDGSILLLRSSALIQDYSTIWAKGLTIVGDVPSGPQPILEWELTAYAVPAGSTVVIRGVQIGQPGVTAAGGIHTDSNAGSVLVEDCTLYGDNYVDNLTSDVPCSAAGGPGLSVKSSDVTAVRCTLIGGNGADDGFQCTSQPGGPGMEIRDLGRVAAWDCSFQGGEGGDGSPTMNGGTFGGAGVLMSTNNSAISSAWGLLSNCEALGGKGGDLGGNGGDGVRVVGLVTDLYRIAVAAGGGPAGSGGQPGVPVSGKPIPPAIPDAPRSFRVDSPLREGQAGQLTLQGEMGEVVFYFASKVGGFLPKLGHNGAFALGAPLGPFGLPPITDVDGQLSVPFVAPNLLLPSDEGNVWLLQPIFVGATKVRLGPPSALILLDSSI